MDENLRKITPTQLVEEFHILEKMARSTGIHGNFCLDDYLEEEVLDAIKELNTLYPDYLFEHKLVFGGFGHDLVVTNIERKKAYDKIPKTRTYGELFENLEHEYKIVTSTKFHHQPNEKMTEKEYQQTLELYKKIGTDFF